MSNTFPDPILNLPLADIPMEGLSAYLAQGTNNQILFMEFENDTQLAEHSHEAQWSIVLEGRNELIIERQKHIFIKGDRYYIPKGARHSGTIYAGYTDITFFAQSDRYKAK
ncbi:MAG: cupin domain-containing protein [Tannerellaceae bacterium]|nr:cupin domain-containing protein [Tannerellaceae bacterium]